MSKQEILEYLNYSLTMLESEIETYRTAIEICDFETMENELCHIEENCHYFEMLTRAFRDACCER